MRDSPAFVLVESAPMPLALRCAKADVGLLLGFGYFPVGLGFRLPPPLLGVGCILLAWEL